MANVTIRELRNNGGKVLERVAGGEQLTVTRDGRPIAELHPLANRAVQSEILLSRWRNLPPVDVKMLKSDIDRALDSSV